MCGGWSLQSRHYKSHSTGERAKGTCRERRKRVKVKGWGRVKASEGAGRVGQNTFLPT
jgi:hypothetical protein